MPAGVQLAVIFVPWSICGMAAARAKERGESTTVPFAAFAVWAVALLVLLATGELGGDLLFG